MSRARSLRERIRGQVNVVAERHRRLSGELQSTVDEGVVSSLEAESARIAADLAATLADKEALAPEFESLEQRAAAMAADLAALEEEWGEGVGPAPVAAAEVRAQLTALRSAAERDRQESNRILEQLETISERRDRLERDGAAAAADAARLEADELPALESAFALAQNDRDRAEVQLEAATEERRRRRRRQPLAGPGRRPRTGSRRLEVPPGPTSSRTGVRRPRHPARPGRHR
ncbi:MAG: hypothetical protein R2710_04960 [Acidimicrobiales bacterium]